MKAGDRVRVARVRESERAHDPNWEWLIGKEGTAVGPSRTEGAWRVALDARPDAPDVLFEDELEPV